MSDGAMRFKRHDLNQNVAFMPVVALSNPKNMYFGKGEPQHGTKRYNDKQELCGWDMSLLDELLEEERLRRYMTHRTDILMVNTNGHLYCVYFDKNGTIVGDTKYFSDDDLNWAKDESRRCWDTALANPVFMKTMYR